MDKWIALLTVIGLSAAFAAREVPKRRSKNGEGVKLDSTLIEQASAGPEPYKKLWLLLFDRLNNYHKLNNLIWVWNGQSGDWYPGDETVDIIGEDVYTDKHDYSSLLERFCTAAGYSKERKIITLSENGVIPDPDNLIGDRTAWSWFCTWDRSFVYDESGNYNEDHTELSMLRKVYSHDYVITRDELPDLKTYPLK